jgi:hypothetical protein
VLSTALESHCEKAAASITGRLLKNFALRQLFTPDGALASIL